MRNQALQEPVVQASTSTTTRASRSRGQSSDLAAGHYTQPAAKATLGGVVAEPLLFSLESGKTMWSAYLQDKILRHVFLAESYTPPSLYAAITDQTPNYDDTGSDLDEPSPGWYSRPLIPDWREPHEHPLHGGYTSSSNITEGLFGVSDEEFHQNYVAWCDAATGGNLLGFANTSIIQTILPDDTVVLSKVKDYNNIGIA